MKLFATLLMICFVQPLLALDKTEPAVAEIKSKDDERRKALWSAFFKAWPINEKKVSVYAENRALTRICFRSQNVTNIFDLSNGKVEPVVHAKVIPPDIQSITYEYDPATKFGSFVLWYYGERELTIGASD